MAKRTYRVTWAIDIEAETPEEAARLARDKQQWPRPGYWCGVFDVSWSLGRNRGLDSKHIDLDEVAPTKESERPAPETRADDMSPRGGLLRPGS